MMFVACLRRKTIWQLDVILKVSKQMVFGALPEGVQRPARDAACCPPCCFEFDGYSRYQDIQFLYANTEFLTVFHLAHRHRQYVVCVCMCVCVCIYIYIYISALCTVQQTDDKAVPATRFEGTQDNQPYNFTNS